MSNGWKKEEHGRSFLEERPAILGGLRWADVSFDSTATRVTASSNVACWVFLLLSAAFIG